MYITFDASDQHPLPSMPPGITAEDVFDAIPGLSMLLETGNSPIEEFTAMRGSWEPHGGSGKLTQCELPERAARPAWYPFTHVTRFTLCAAACNTSSYSCARWR